LFGGWTVQAAFVTTSGLWALPLDPRAAAALWQQLYHGLRAAILDGRLPPGTRLPSTRDLATELAVSRTTVLNAFVAARSLVSRHAPTIDQAVVAAFMVEGHFDRHIRRMRVLYAERQAALVEAASQRLSGLLEVRPSDAGMHLIGWLPEGVDDGTIAEVAASHGLEVPPLSAHSARPLTRGGLLLGYTAFAPGQIREAVRALALLLEAAVD